MSKSALNIVVALGFTAVACAGDDLSLAGEVLPDDPRFDSITRQMGVAVQAGPGAYAGLSPGTPVGSTITCNTTSCLPDQLDLAIFNACMFTTGLGRVSGACGQPVQAAEDNICAANMLILLAQTASAIDVPLGGKPAEVTGTVRIGPQDAVSNYELARLALLRATAAATLVNDTFDSVRTPGCLNTGTAGQGNTLNEPALSGSTLSLGEELVHFLRESIEATNAAAGILETNATAVSDAARSTSTDYRTASVLALANTGSRTAGAHALVGGAYGMPALLGVGADGFFTRPPLTSEGQNCLAMLRAAAPNPALIESETVTIDNLVLATGGVSVADSLRRRVGLRLNRPSVTNAVSSVAFASALGTTVAALTEAREYLREEIRAFDRRGTNTLAAEELGDGTLTSTNSIILYASTRLPPSPLLASYWAAIARYDPSPRIVAGSTTFNSAPVWEFRPRFTGGTAYPPGYTYGDETSEPYTTTIWTKGLRTAASALDEMYGYAPAIIGRMCPTTCTGASANIRRILSDLLSEGTTNPNASGVTSYANSSYLGRARSCWFDATASTTNIRVDVDTPNIAASRLAVVYGRDGLECAVLGTIDGVPCTTSQFGTGATPLLRSAATFAANAYGTFPGAAALVAPPITTRPTGAAAASIFVVARRPEYTGTVAPGQFDQLTGFILSDPNDSVTGYRYCQQTAIIPPLDEATRRLLQPDPAILSRFHTSCAGLPSDMRIPLENELTDDGNGIESSWRHYLDLATRSANDADRLGEELIRVGLDMDLRAEEASDELSRLCGVPINLSNISALFATAAAGTPPALPCTATPGWVQRNPPGGGMASCVPDPVLFAAANRGIDPDLDRLATCLGTDTVPWVALGNTPLCMWDQDPLTPSGICEGRNPENRCPAPNLGAPASCTVPGYLPGGTAAITVNETLNLFGPLPDPEDDDGVLENLADLPCGELARLRSGTATPADLTKLYSSSFLTYSGFLRHARNLSWEAAVGDYSTVLYGGATAFRTGTPALGDNTVWPMAGGANANTACPVTAVNDPAGLAPFGGYTGSVFCIQNVGSSALGREARSRMNNVLSRAVIAARTIAGLGLDDLVLPYYGATSAYSYFTNLETFNWAPVGGNLCASGAGQFLIDDDSGFFTSPAYTRELSDFGVRACRRNGADGSTVHTGCTTLNNGYEWTNCPYDRHDGAANVECFVFDEAMDCDDGVPGGGERNAPLILSSVGEQFTRVAAAEDAMRVWRTRMRPIVGSLALFAGSAAGRATYSRRPFLARAELEQLTAYFDRSGCPFRQDYESCVTASDSDVRLSASNNLGAPLAYYSFHTPAPGEGWSPDTGLTMNDVLNGLEIACTAARSGLPATDTSCARPTAIDSIADADRMATFMDCQANEITAGAAASVVRNLPRTVYDSLRATGPSTYGDSTGEVAAQVSEIRSALFAMRSVRSSMAADIRSYTANLRALRGRVSGIENQARIEEIASMGRQFDRMTACIVAATETITSDGARATGAALGATATCANSIGQWLLEAQMQELRAAGADDALLVEFANFDDLSTRTAQALTERANAVSAELQRIDAALSRLRAAQAAARRALSRALYLNTDGAGTHFSVNAVYRARYSTALSRYREAHHRALRAAFIARIAVEQRLGMSLAQLSDDLFSDEAPRDWVDTLCTLPSIDYDRLRTTSGTDSTPVDFSGSFVGDYVRRLEQVIESYSFVNPFREGTDTSVVSVRDDVFASRAPCDVASPNLLLNGGRLDVLGSLGRPGWTQANCAATIPACATAGCPCMTVERTAGSFADYPSGSAYESDISAMGGYRVSFLHGSVNSRTTLSSALTQSVALVPGRYRLSWYGRAAVDDPPQTAVTVSGTGVSSLSTWTSESVVALGVPAPGVAAGPTGWARYWAFFEVSRGTTATVAVGQSGLLTATARSVEIAGVMLEDVTDSVVGDVETATETVVRGADGASTTVLRRVLAAPPAFIESGDSGSLRLPVCRDSTGDFFRRRAFVPGCVRVCDDGFSADCAGSPALTRCFRDVSFDISSDTLSRILTDGDAGFAGGNHNYRIDSIAVNLVGTNLRDCGADGTSGCFAAGSFSYSVLHSGPYLVRNALGALYDAPLFPGRIESARALAGERYITNPISSADRTLIEPYTRVELGGRPLGGALTIRIWDDEALVWDNLEDIQVVLNYRYWTHQR